MDLLEMCCASRKLWEEILLTIQHAVVIADMEGNILFASPFAEELLCFSRGMLVGRNLSTIFMPEDLACLYQNVLYMAKNDRSFEGEIMLLRGDGTQFIGVMNTRPCYDAELAQPIVICSIRDIDTQKKFREAPNKSYYEDLIKLAEGIAQEIRNPLVDIGDIVSRIHNTCEGIPDSERYYSHIFRNLNKIEELVGKVEFFTQFPKAQLRQVNIKALVDTALGPHLQKIRGVGLELIVSVGEQDFLADETQVVKGISILIENAMDALRDGGMIKIYTELSENRLVLHVEDNGTGIAPQDLPFVFNPFFSTKPEGVGIDLAIVRRIMEMHGGQVDVTSAPSRKTDFSLQFPLERRRPIRTVRFLDNE